MKPKVLFVDDEPEVLSSFLSILKIHYDISTSDNPVEAVSIVKNNGPFSVVVSDYRMPKMNGVELLSEIMKIEKNTTRILLTGYSDFQAIVQAINNGNIYRYLTKPIVIEQLINNIDDGIRQFNLLKSEKELLEKTLKGSVKLLMDILSVSNTKSFVRVSRVKNIVKRLASKLNYEPLWEVEIAVMLSEIGLVGVPFDIVDKKERRLPLTPEEIKIYNNHPKIGSELIKNIPRLENIARVIEYQSVSNFTDFDPSELESNKALMLSEIITVAKIYDKISDAGLSHLDAIDYLNKRKNFSPHIIKLLEIEFGEQDISRSASIESVFIEDLKEDMILAEDIVDNFGMILYAKGKELSDMIILRIKSMAKNRKIIQPIKVIRYKENY